MENKADIDALRLPKVELETKLGLLHNTVAALPDPEAVKAELEELADAMDGLVLGPKATTLDGQTDVLEVVEVRLDYPNR